MYHVAFQTNAVGQDTDVEGNPEPVNTTPPPAI